MVLLLAKIVHGFLVDYNFRKSFIKVAWESPKYASDQPEKYYLHSK